MISCVQWGKLTIGTHFALKKLAKLSDMEKDSKVSDTDMRKFAAEAVQRVKNKGIVLPNKLAAKLAAVKGKSGPSV